MKKKRSRRTFLHLAISLMPLLLLASTASSGRRAARAGAPTGDSGVCMSQCHVNMSDCLGDGGGYSCIESFYECSAGCNQLLQ
jgi:hypothetical protein